MRRRTYGAKVIRSETVRSDRRSFPAVIIGMLSTAKTDPRTAFTMVQELLNVKGCRSKLRQPRLAIAFSRHGSSAIARRA